MTSIIEYYGNIPSPGDNSILELRKLVERINLQLFALAQRVGRFDAVDDRGNLDGPALASQQVVSDSATATKAYADSLVKNLGAWAARTEDTNYTATTDGFLIASVISDHVGDQGHIEGETPIGTVRAHATCDRAAGIPEQAGSFCLPIRSGDTYKIILTVDAGTPVVEAWWIPHET